MDNRERWLKLIKKQEERNKIYLDRAKNSPTIVITIHPELLGEANNEQEIRSR